MSERRHRPIGQIKAGSTRPDRVFALGPLGVASSTGTLRFVPSGFAGAGRLKIVSYNASRWYDAEISPDGDGTFGGADLGILLNQWGSCGR